MVFRFSFSSGVLRYREFSVVLLQTLAGRFKLSCLGGENLIGNYTKLRVYHVSLVPFSRDTNNWD